MSQYVLYDPEVKEYVKVVCGKTVPDWKQAKRYKRLAAALSPNSGAGLMNVSRNIPPGPHRTDGAYRNRPNVEVHEFDDNGNFVQSHVAPPEYIVL